MKAFRFLQLDVFTDELFGGNQLAVLPDARGIPDDLMQRIAREMAFSETTFGQPIDEVAAIAATLGLEAQDIRATGLPVQEVSSGAPFVFVPIATRAAVDRAIPDVRAMRQLFERIGSDAHGVYIFTTDSGSDRVTTYSRMFSADLGIPEDPATGGAGGPLGAYLVQHRVVPASAATRMLNLQGVKMLRPSLIHISINPHGSTPERPRVGGTSVLAAEGTINVPI